MIKLVIFGILILNAYCKELKTYSIPFKPQIMHPAKPQASATILQPLKTVIGKIFDFVYQIFDPPRYTVEACLEKSQIMSVHQCMKSRLAELKNNSENENDLEKYLKGEKLLNCSHSVIVAYSEMNFSSSDSSLFKKAVKKCAGEL